jgi:protein-S-isoprenylcysteine O-methyltransferase Ste14
MKMQKRFVMVGTIALYFAICLEILIMISPFAGFFYAVFNPFLLLVSGNPATRWLSAFFLPHLVIPSDPFLIALRVAGSVLLVTGLGLFLLCAVMVYGAKFRRRGAVVGGPYRVIRHPQYLALAVCGTGLAILWPRILTAALWCAMILAYYWLAKDEERRMVAAHPEEYGAYRQRTGMFLPPSLERRILPPSATGRGLAFVLLTGLAMGAVFGLRTYTIRHLTLWSADNVTAIAILPEDGLKMAHRMADILAMEEVRRRLQPESRYLVYVVPTDYIMQGLIADTGGDWRLYQHHHSWAMITDWIFHPFRHLRQGHRAMAGAGHHPHPGMTPSAEHPGAGATRRLIVLRLENVPLTASPFADFALGVHRVPELFFDVDLHQGQLVNLREVPHTTTGWGEVPTPTF